MKPEMTEYDFTSHYKVREIIYLVNVSECTTRKLKLRTVKPSFMVGNLDKGDTSFIGRDKKDYVYKSFMDAKLYLDSLGKTAKLDIVYDIPDQLKEMDGEDE